MIWPTDYLNKVICGDCLEVMKGIPDKSVDLVLTDPPYGHGDKWAGGTWATNEKYADCFNWDTATPTKEYFDEIFRISKNQIIWGGNYFTLPKTRCVLIWDKVFYVPTLSDVEMAWTSFDKTAKKYAALRQEDFREHPTQKPLDLFRWILTNYSDETDLILDPFFGSGTTGVAAKLLGRQFVGIEISEKYCDIARKRIDATLVNRKLEFANDKA